MHCQEMMLASVKSASLATATDDSLHFKFIKVTTPRVHVYPLSHDISVFRLQRITI